jgi:23S rRNA (uracil1939-C5)-methyltransferase
VSQPSLHRKLTIERLGQRAEGIARGEDGLIFVPHALPGETVVAEVDGERGKLIEVLTPSADRVPAFCPYYGTCGGCAIQVLAQPAYAKWKRGLVEAALSHAKLELPLADLIDAHGAGRRRATFHARFERDALGRLRREVGFMQARAHVIVEIDACPILDPAMAGAVAAAQGVARVLSQKLKPLDILVTATDEGLDIDVRGTGALLFELDQALVSLAERLDLARISNHGTVVIERRAPTLTMGRARVPLPPGSFLQATAAGEATLARLVLDAVGPAKRVADLFAGVGTFTHRLAEKAEVHAVESDAAALAALQRGANGTPGIRMVTTERRDLSRRPLQGTDLSSFDAVVCDPPRAGAEEQMQALAASTVQRVASVSCNVQTFARDAAILIAGGYVCEGVVPVDQFRHSTHVELVGTFRRPKAKSARRRNLLG